MKEKEEEALLRSSHLVQSSGTLSQKFSGSEGNSRLLIDVPQLWCPKAKSQPPSAFLPHATESADHGFDNPILPTISTKTNTRVLSDGHYQRVGVFFNL